MKKDPSASKAAPNPNRREVTFITYFAVHTGMNKRIVAVFANREMAEEFRTAVGGGSVTEAERAENAGLMRVIARSEELFNWFKDNKVLEALAHAWQLLVVETYGFTEALLTSDLQAPPAKKK